MSPELKTEYDKTLKLILESKESMTVGEAYKNSIQINAFLSFFEAHKINAEINYRNKLIEYEVDEISHAKAENQAKTTDDYRDYLLLKSLIDRGVEQIRILKKFQNGMEQEYQNSNF